jgi:murein DD-endopeptidase MepM/ murein hydrolase activator NlpD
MQVKIKVQSTKKRRMGRLPLLIFILVCFVLFLFLSFLPKVKRESAKTEAPIAKPEKSLPQETRNPTFRPMEKKEIIQSGETLSDILSRYSFSPAEIHKLRTEVKPVYDLAKITAGREIRLYSGKDETIGAIEYDLGSENYLYIQNHEGAYKAEIKKLPIETELRIIWGTIENNLPYAITKEGEKEVLAYELAEIFAWDIDFAIDLRQGDSFKILFEKKYLKGKFIGYGPIQAAEFTNQGDRFTAFRYTYPDTQETDYFNAEGQSLRKEFLKSPFKYTPRITSTFSYSRLHPVRKIYRPHYGVDYAAKPGTPVYVTADGTVLYAGWHGASGRMIHVRHKNHYETMYLHLQKCFVKKGDKVKSGDKIGEVGASGEVTGPHLDYRIKYAGKYINPLSHRFKPVKPLRPEFLGEFMQLAQNYSLYLDSPLIIFSAF